MFKRTLIFLFCLGIALGGVLVYKDVEELDHDDEDFDSDDEELIFKPEAMLLTDAELGEYVWNFMQENWNLDGFRNLKDFKWNNCGGVAGGVVSMSLSPDPIKTGEIMVAVTAVANMTLAAPLETKLKIEYELPIVKTWVEIPCIDQFGSCTYPDICKVLDGVDCPEALKEHNIPCKCPYVPRTYTLPASTFTLDVGPPKGNYRATGQIYQNGSLLACLSVQLTFD